MSEFRNDCVDLLGAFVCKPKRYSHAIKSLVINIVKQEYKKLLPWKLFGIITVKF